MAEAPQRKTIVASGYKQVGSRATPEAIEKEIKKLPESAGPIDTRKRALHDLAHALAYVQEQHKVTVVEKCKGTNAVGLLVQLLTDIESAPPVTAAEDVIRVGRRVLGMGPMDARLYVLSCFVNLSYLGGAGQLRNPPDGQTMSAMEILFDTLLITQDSESVLFYSVAGLYNLSNDGSFAQVSAPPRCAPRIAAWALLPNHSDTPLSFCLYRWPCARQVCLRSCSLSRRVPTQTLSSTPLVPSTTGRSMLLRAHGLPSKPTFPKSVLCCNAASPQGVAVLEALRWRRVPRHVIRGRAESGDRIRRGRKEGTLQMRTPFSRRWPRRRARCTHVQDCARKNGCKVCGCNQCMRTATATARYEGAVCGARRAFRSVPPRSGHLGAAARSARRVRHAGAGSTR